MRRGLERSEHGFNSGYRGGFQGMYITCASHNGNKAAKSGFEISPEIQNSGTSGLKIVHVYVSA